MSRMWHFMFGSRKYKTLVLGLNNAGKTSILYALQLGKLVPTQPTLGSNCEELTWGNVSFIAWDLGGQELLRHSWSLFYSNTDAVIFVVDSADPGTFPLVATEMHRALSHPDLANACVLVFANKQDLTTAVAPVDVAKALGLDRLTARHWTILGCSAASQEGLRVGLAWIADHVKA